MSDLLHYYPFRYIDKSKISKVSDIQHLNDYYQLQGNIISIKEVKQKKGRRLEAVFNDGSGSIKLVWFKGVQWIKDYIKGSEEYLLFGKPSSFQGQLNMAHPEMQKVSESLKNGTKIQPIYHSCEALSKKGLNSKGIEKLCFQLIKTVSSSIKEVLNTSITEKYGMPTRAAAFKNIHFPSSEAELDRAKWRLKFEEFFFLQLRLARQQKLTKQQYLGLKFPRVGAYFNSFYNDHLPFDLTNAQKKVLKEIRHDVKSGYQMNRLMQGDVGSGKTIVALFAMLLAKDNQFQSCLMAPTEILANQHFETLVDYLKEMKVNVALLTGSTKKSERKIIDEGLKTGSIDIIVGTHALLEDWVTFNNLGFVVIDEQHRFGVAQRARLWKKNKHVPHVLVMTATPIPRTLAMTVYGDLDVSVIDELPPGRKKVNTIHRFEQARLQVFNFLEKEIEKGRQVYIVYPLIEESSTLDYKDLMDGFEAINRRFPKPNYQISIVHGRMKSEDKDFEMRRFSKGETQIMVATTVIEVGVNVPNASIMLIESAERFGLSQLHQLRGRVGRGAEQSHCILMTGYKLSNDAKRRMDTMVRTNDGFEISEVDLELRGPGDIMGTQQSGIPEFRIASLVEDQEILKHCRNEAFALLESDPELNAKENQLILEHYQHIKKSQKDWSIVS